MDTLVVDKQENIWISQGWEISRFDGQKWTVFTATHGLTDSLHSLAVGLDGTVWAGRNRWTGQDAEWQSYSMSDGLRSNDISAVHNDAQGRAWFAPVLAYPNPKFTSEFIKLGLGVSEFDGQTWRFYTMADGLAHNDVRAITSDKSGRVWFGTWGGGVSEFDGQTWRTYTTTNEPVSNEIRAIAVDRQTGHTWFGTTHGVSEFDGHTWRTHQTLTTSLASNFVQTMAIDQDGHKWFGYGERGSGVTEFDGRAWKTYTSRDGLINDFVYAITIDKAGRKWFGTAGGVSRFDGQQWLSYTPADGLVHNFVQAIAVDEATDQVWFGTRGDGVSVFDGQTWTTYPLKEDNDSRANDIRAIAIDRAGHKWFAITTEEMPIHGRNPRAIISRLDGKYWTNYDRNNFRDIYGDSWDVAVDRNGHLWAGTTEGAYRFDGQTWTPYLLKKGLANKEVRTVEVDQEGHVWFGTWGGGVSEFDSQTWTTYTTAGLADNEVYAIAIDQKGQQWFGTAGGISRFDGQTWTTYTTAHGLAPKPVRAFAFDQAGHIWASHFDEIEGGVSANSTANVGLFVPTPLLQLLPLTQPGASGLMIIIMLTIQVWRI